MVRDNFPTMKKALVGVVLIAALLVCWGISTVWAWHDMTHLAVAKAAGYTYWFNSAGADIAKLKAAEIEARNHYFDNHTNSVITDKMVLAQALNYDNPDDEEGHLYGAIVASLRKYRESTESGRYAEYHMAYAAHYIGDLSQPLHNILFDNFNTTHHAHNDAILENEVLEHVASIKGHMYKIKLNRDTFEQDLAREIARIGNISRQLGLRLRAENRDMTKKEAYIQVGHSASFLKAVLSVLEPHSPL